MTRPGRTHATLVVDRSGSMQTVQRDAQGAINQYVEDQRNQPGELTLTIIDFDTTVTTVTDFTPIADVEPYTLTPRGGTALLDAVGTAIAQTGERLAALPEDDRPEHVIIGIVTDGDENSSTEWTMDQVKESIRVQTDTYNWSFVFLGADQSAWTGHAMGIRHTHSYAGTGAGTQDAYGTMSRVTSTVRSTGQVGDI